MSNKIADNIKTSSSTHDVKKQDVLLEYQKQLQSEISELNKLSHIPANVKKRVKIAQAQQVLNAKTIDVDTLLDNMSDILSLYQSAVVEFNNELYLYEENNENLITQYVDKLLNIADDFQLTSTLNDKLEKIYGQLKNTKTTKSLYHSFEKIIDLLILNINGEKEATKYFLDALNNALLDVKNIVANGSALTNNSSQKRKQWDTSLKSHVDKISSLLEKKNSKQHISNEVGHMLAAITDKEKFDQQEKKQLLNNFKAMEQQLKTVETEAQGYKTKLQEQEVLSMQDSLTKLPNRAALDKRFSAEFKRVKATDSELWVVVADLDFFKKINDTYGHAAGDKTLRVIASVLSRSLRGSEFIARFGGEEFVILVPDISKVALTNMLNRVREKIKSIPFKFKNCDVQVTISMGATMIKSRDASEKFSFERADKALYQAKAHGRDQVIVN
jgi:diguanylate cyclase (GGDEF)-like protein